MRYLPLLLLAMAIGCSNPTRDLTRTIDDASRSPATSVRSTESAAVASSPKHKKVLVVIAAKKGDKGASCSAGMGTKGKLTCGPASSLTELSYEFTEHRDGADYYKFQWNLTSNGEPKNNKALTVGFDGNTEITVIDAEHYIFIRKKPLSTEPKDAN
jgi:hypothetical protein